MSRFFRELGQMLSLSAHFFAQTLKAKMAYRWDFFIQTAGTILYSIMNIMVIASLLHHAPQIVGWSLWEVLLIYGAGELSFGLFAIFCFNAVHLLPGHYIVEGNLDRVLLRPLNSYLQVVLESISTNDFVIVLKGLAIVAVATTHLDTIAWTFTTVFVGGLLIFSGAVIYCALFTSVAALSFWFKDRGGLVSPLFAMSDYSRYPLTIYPSAVRIFFSWVFPFAFVAYYPAGFLLHKEGVWTMAPAGLGVALGFSLLAATLWKAGLRRYESTGT